MFLALGDDWQVHYFVFDVILKYNKKLYSPRTVCLSLCYFGKRYYLTFNVARLHIVLWNRSAIIV